MSTPKNSTDVYATIREAPTALQERLVDVLEMRVNDPQQRAMWHAYIGGIEFPPEARVLEIGWRTGAVTRILAQWPNVAAVVGVDPSPIFIANARTLAEDIPNITFEEGDGRALRFAAAAFDVAVAHQALSHVPEPERLLAEAWRVLRPGGWLAVFDGDYATATVATSDLDPLAACAHAFRRGFIHDSWVMRRLPQLLKASGFEAMPMRSYGYAEAPSGAYLLTWIDRGADALAVGGHIGQETAAALKAEARRRSAAGTWFGHIAFASILAQKPA